MALVVCGQCDLRRSDSQAGCWWQGRWFCSFTCSHAAGDRTACLGWDCGCTRYAKKRRLLRSHRVNMRVMDDVIHENGLGEELEDRLVEQTGNANFWLASDSENLDEPSDAEDPEEQLRATVDGLRAEATDQRAMVQAVQGRWSAAACFWTWSGPGWNWRTCGLDSRVATEATVLLIGLRCTSERD